MSKGEETRSAVLGSALALATQVGLEGLTIGKLADHVGMSKSGLFAHFSSKENLQVAILDEASERFVAHVVAPALKKPRGEPRVRALFEGWLSWSKLASMPGGCIFVVAAVELDDRPGPARDRLVATQKDWLATLGGAFRIGVEEAHFRADADVPQLAYEMYSLAHGYHFARRILDPKVAESRVRAAFEILLQRARGAST